MPALDPSLKNALIWGSKGHAKVLAELLGLTGYRTIALFDNDPAAQPSVPGVPLHIGADGFARFLAGRPDGPLYGFVAIGGGHGRARVDILDLFGQHGIETPSAIHPDATVSATARIGAGCQVLARAVVASDASLGRGCIVNHGAVVDHDTRVGAGVHLAPAATLCGDISVGDFCFVAAGATVLPRVSIGAGATVGAGAVVTRDVPDNTTVIGVPARPVDTESR